MLPLTPDAVVFDLDGLLADTETRWTVAETRLFARHGLPYGEVEKARMIGRSVESVSVELAQLFARPGEHLTIATELVAEVMAILAEGVEALPGAVELVARCASRVPVAVASNSDRPYVDLVLEAVGLSDYLPVRVTTDDVVRPKPDPEPYLLACSRLGADPSRSVAFEDTELGASAARAAGLTVVGVPSLEGTVIGCDLQVASLTDPVLVAWSRELAAASA